MKGLKPTLVAAIAIGLLAGSAVGIAAQETETEAPAEFTATWDHNFGPGIRPNVSEGFDPTHGRGYANHPLIIESAGDPRFEGEVTLVVNHDTYEFDGGLRVFHRAFSVENDEGTWRGVPHPSLVFGDGEAAGATQLFIGEGGYAGFYALADIQDDEAGEAWMLRGVIFEGEPPPAPEPFVSE